MMSDVFGNVPAALVLLRARMGERKRLRSHAGLTYAIADSISLLDAGAWRTITSEASFFLSYDYLRSMEAVLPVNIGARYALIYQDSGAGRTPVAAVYMQIADVSLAQARPVAAQPGKLDTLARAARQRILVCGNLLTFGQHGVALAAGADTQLAWHGVAEVLYRVRQGEKLARGTEFVMIKDLHPPYTAQAAQLEKLSYRYVETEPNMVLTLIPAWKSHDDYLASLASKYRSKVRTTVFKAIADSGCSVEHLTDVAGAADQLHALYKAVQVNAGFRPFELVPDYFAALQQVAGERFRCSVIKRDGVYLGFLISLADGDTAVAYHIGFDRAASADLPLYLRLLHAGIADAIDMGCKQISYGRTALEPKAALGAKPQAFGVLVRHRQPVLNKLIKHLLLGVEHDDAPERSPFKRDQAGGNAA